MTIHDAPLTDPSRTRDDGTAAGDPGAGGVGATEPADAPVRSRWTDLAGAAPKLGYQPALDGLRGLALLAIVVYHAELPFAPGAFLSVSTFFTLSGFLITALALSEFASSGRFSLRSFWTRRFRRLLPAAVCAIGAIVLFSFAFADSTQRTQIPGDALASLFYVANWRFVLTGESYGAMFQSPSPFTHFWTLSIEEQFYLVFPVVLATTFFIARGSRKALAVVFGVLVAASTIWSATLMAGGASIDRIYFGTDTRLAELVAGSLLALWWMRPDRRPGRVQHRALIGAGALVLMLALWVLTDQQQRVWYSGGLTIYACVTLAVILGALQPRGPVRQLLGVRPLVWVGKVSYAAYLIHWPVLLWLDRAAGLDPRSRFVVGLTITLVLAGLFTRLVERPIRLGTWLPDRQGTVAIPFAFLTVIAIIAASSVTAPEDRTTVDFAQVQQDVNAITGGAPPPTSAEEQFQAWAKQQATLKASTAPRVAWFGDSTALMNSMGFADWTYLDEYRSLAPETGTTILGCGLLTGINREYMDQRGPINDDCNTYLDQWRESVTKARVDIAVVQVGPWDVLDQQLTPGGPYLTIGEDPELDRALRAALERGVATLLEHVPFVVLVEPPDIMPGMVDERPPTVPFRESDPARMDRFRAIVREVAERTPHVASVDLESFLAVQADPWSFRPDGVHTSVDAARVVGAWLGPELIRLRQLDQSSAGGI